MDKILAVLDEAAFGGLDEVHQALYKQNTEDKQYYFRMPPDEAAKLAVNLQADRDKFKRESETFFTEMKAAKAERDKFKSLGFESPEDIKTELDKGRSEDVATLVDKHRKEIEAKEASWTETLGKKDTHIADLERNVTETLNRSCVNELILKHNLTPNAADTLERQIRTERVEDADGKATYVQKVYTREGQVMLDAMQEVTPDGLIDTWRESKTNLNLFKAEAKGGPGGSGQPNQYQFKQNFSDLSPTERLSAARRQGV